MRRFFRQLNYTYNPYHSIPRRIRYITGGVETLSSIRDRIRYGVSYDDVYEMDWHIASVLKKAMEQVRDFEISAYPLVIYNEKGEEWYRYSFQNDRGYILGKPSKEDIGRQIWHTVINDIIIGMEAWEEIQYIYSHEGSAQVKDFYKAETNRKMLYEKAFDLLKYNFGNFWI